MGNIFTTQSKKKKKKNKNMSKTSDKKESTNIKKIESDEEFYNYLKKYKNIVVKFGAEWCNPCRRIMPYFETLSLELKNTKDLKEVPLFIEIDIDEFPQLNEKYGGDSIPYFVILSGEKVKDKIQTSNEGKLKSFVYSNLSNLK